MECTALRFGLCWRTFSGSGSNYGKRVRNITTHSRFPLSVEYFTTRTAILICLTIISPNVHVVLTVALTIFETSNLNLLFPIQWQSLWSAAFSEDLMWCVSGRINCRKVSHLTGLSAELLFICKVIFWPDVWLAWLVVGQVSVEQGYVQDRWLSGKVVCRAGISLAGLSAVILPVSVLPAGQASDWHD